MENSEVEEVLNAIGEPKLHGGMCKALSLIYGKVLGILPDLEAARPRSTSGIQSLCSLHLALEKTKNVLQHCSGCSKLYLAVTGDSVVLKCEKARSALQDSLRRVEDIVPQAISGQISDILDDIEKTEFSLDPLEKKVGDDIIELLQQGRNLESNSTDNHELEVFHQAASRLGITSSRSALRERRALRNLREKARIEEDKRKECIVAYFLHLMKMYSKMFRGDFSDDNDSQGSTPCSPTVQGPFEGCGSPMCNSKPSERQLSISCSFNFKTPFTRPGQMPIPPEELRCPISLQLMYDPVVIASGQTYERVCIEKWFDDGHNTCPKTQQQLSHLCLTPNYCVKGLIASWCEHNGVPVPTGAPVSLDLNYWRLAFSESKSTKSKSMESIRSCKFKCMQIVPLEENNIIEEAEGDELSVKGDLETNVFERYGEFLNVLDGEECLREKSKVVEQVRHLLKDDDEARIYMGANGFVEPLLRFFESAVNEGNEVFQEIGAVALFNLAVNNNRNKERMLAAGVLSLLGEMISVSSSVGSATALYLNISCLDEAKPIIGSSEAVPFLIHVIQSDSSPQCKLDALHTLFNLSTHPPNNPGLTSAGIIDGLQEFLTDAVDHTWTEKAIAVLINLALCQSARDDIISSQGVISGLSTILDVGRPTAQEYAATCLYILCNGNEKCSLMVLQEGVIPSLVSMSMTGTMRGKQKAQKLLMLFREQRQRDPPQVEFSQEQFESKSIQVPKFVEEEPKPMIKSILRKNMTRSWSFSKCFSVQEC